MTRYYFHIKQGDQTVLDDEGIECESLYAVRDEALQSAREIMGDGVRSGALDESRTFVVKDDKGDIVHELPFQAAISHSSVDPHT
jgi:hypothetical protein